jgi:hypothetical protein
MKMQREFLNGVSFLRDNARGARERIEMGNKVAE